MKYASSVLVVSESALYFSLLLLIPGFSGLFSGMLLILGLIFFSLLLAELLEKYLPLRILASLLPLLAFLILPREFHTLFLLPPVLYALLSGALGRFYREYWRYLRVFRLLLVPAAAFLVIALVNDPMMKNVLILLALFIFPGLIGLRMLRMEGSGSAKWRLLNGLSVLLPPLVLFGLSAGLAFLFSHAGRIFEFLIMRPLAWFLRGVTFVMGNIFRSEKMAEEMAEETAETLIETTEAAAQGVSESTEAASSGFSLPPVDLSSVNPRIFLAVLLVILLFVVVLLVVLRRKKTVPAEETAPEQGSFFRPVRERRSRKKLSSPVQRIRSCYREYLSLMKKAGLRRAPGTTSLEVMEKTKALNLSAPASALRALYLQARYNNSAAKEDAEKAEEILSEIRRSL